MDLSPRWSQALSAGGQSPVPAEQAARSTGATAQGPRHLRLSSQDTFLAHVASFLLLFSYVTLLKMPFGTAMGLDMGVQLHLFT